MCRKLIVIMLGIIYVNLIPCSSFSQGLISFSNQDLNRSDVLSYNQTDEKSEDDTLIGVKTVRSKKMVRYNNPGIALLMATVPGFFVRGLGHLYAGHKKTFYLLLSSEIIVVSWVMAYAGARHIEDEVGYTWTTLFFVPWLYDIIASPIVCIRDNKKRKNIIESLSFQPYIKNNQFGNQLGVRLSYRF